MPSSIRFVIIPVVLLITSLIEIVAPVNRSANYPPKVSTPVFAPEAQRISVAQSFAPEALRIPVAQSFAPEAQRILDGGGAQRNHRNRRRNLFPAPEGRQTNPSLSPLRGWESISDCIRWILHRLISGVPPGQRVIKGAAQTVLFGRQSPKMRRYEDSRVSMGCVYTVVVYGREMALLREAAAAALDEVDRIDRLMSHYKEDSKLSQINREAAKAPVKVDPELSDFIAECLRYSRESEGAFDITVGPLMKVWGFFRGEGRMPNEAELAQARNHVGYKSIILNQKDGTIFFDKAGVEIDLGGIAKGYAVDRAVAELKRHGVTSALLSAGGSTIYALGAPPGKPAWEIEVQDPVERDKIATRVRLKDQALSVSGSYEKFFEFNGARYSHVMDPRTGRPVQGVLSVAVITDDGTSGDALDNVFYVFGAERSRAWLSKFSVSEVIFFLPDHGGKWKIVRIGAFISR
jgi:FAD:protein FMN transferase